jgi:hypothetical protein
MTAWRGSPKPVIGPGQMQGALDYVGNWSDTNDMNLNKPKTKFMEISFSQSGQAHPLTPQGEILEKVDVTKLLGIYVQDNLKWNVQVDKLVTKGSQRLQFLTAGKKAGMDQEQLLTVYKARIRSLLEYACQVWSPGLTVMQENDIERIQKRALHTICPQMSYKECLKHCNMITLKAKHTNLCYDLYCKIKNPENPPV